MKRCISGVLGVILLVSLAHGNDGFRLLDGPVSRPPSPPIVDFERGVLRGPEAPTGDLELSDVERAWLRGLVEQRGDGGGADVANLVVIQTSYVESNCPFVPEGGEAPVNVVLLIWEEPVPSVEGVDLIVDDIFLLTYDLANGPLFFLTEVPAGVHTFRIEDGVSGTADTVELEILDRQPMADVEGLEFAQIAPVADDGTCPAALSYKNVCPVPDTYTVIVRGTTDGGGAINAPFPGHETFWSDWLVGGVPAGTYTATMLGFLSYNGAPDAMYRSCFISTPAETRIECDAAECSTPPTALTAYQYEFAATDGQNSLLMLWRNGTEYTAGPELLANGTPLQGGVLPIGANNWLITGPAGEVTLGVRGNCGASTTEADEITITVVDVSPHQNPVANGIACAFDPDTADTNASWTNADCSFASWRFNFAEPVEDVLDALVVEEFLWVPGNATGDTVSDTEPGDPIEYQFFTWSGDLRVGSPRVPCGSASDAFFIRAVCADPAGSDSPQLNDGIFILNFLFRSGPKPQCIEACDNDDDGSMQLNDAVYLFQFLFLTGPAPAGWIGSTPTCAPIEEGMDCEVPNANCPM